MYVSTCVLSLPLLSSFSLADSDCIQCIFRFCPWELPLCPPVSCHGQFPLSVPPWELPTWRVNEQIFPCWNTFPLPFIFLLQCNNLESLSAVPGDIFCFAAYSLSADVSSAKNRCHISCEKRVFRVWDLHELNKWIGEHANCSFHTCFSLILYA